MWILVNTILTTIRWETITWMAICQIFYGNILFTMSPSFFNVPPKQPLFILTIHKMNIYCYAKKKNKWEPKIGLNW